MIPTLVGGTLALAVLLVVLFRLRSGGKGGQARREPALAGGQRQAGGGSGTARPGSCALCGSTLLPGQRIKSDVGPGKGDRMMRIFGCPHCLPGSEAALGRRCPVCGQGLGSADHAIARLFEKPGRQHVHVLGCTLCRGPGKEQRHGR